MGHGIYIGLVNKICYSVSAEQEQIQAGCKDRLLVGNGYTPVAGGAGKEEV